jgi:hypothetical protein
MTADPQERIAQYERGAITSGELEILLVEAAATGAAPERIAMFAPTEIIRLIRERTTAPRDTKWLRCVVATVPRDLTPDQMKAHKEREARELKMWHEGLERWRKYFESSTG